MRRLLLLAMASLAANTMPSTSTSAMQANQWDTFGADRTEAWEAVGGITADAFNGGDGSTPGCGFMGGGCLQVTGAAGDALVIRNQTFWSGNWLPSGPKKIHLRVNVQSGPNIRLRAGITDADPGGSGVGTCYVSEPELVTTGTGYARVSFDLTTFMKVTAGSSCAPSTRTLTDVLRKVSELRIVSWSASPPGPPIWDGDPINADFEVRIDNVRLESETTTLWRVLGVKANAGDCPLMPASVDGVSCGDWVGGHTFGTDDALSATLDPVNQALPPVLKAHCIYQFEEGTPATDYIGCTEAIATDSFPDGLGWVGADIIGIAPPEPVSADTIQGPLSGPGGTGVWEEAIAYAPIATHFARQIGIPSDWTSEQDRPFPKPPGTAPVWIGVVDTHPLDPAFDPSSPPPQSPHGVSLLHIANQTLCGIPEPLDDFNTDPQCVATLLAEPGMDIVSTALMDTTNCSTGAGGSCTTRQRRDDRGGYVGLVGQYARSLWLLTRSWMDDPRYDNGPDANNRLVVNISAGQIPELGGTDTLWRRTSAPHQALYNVLEYQRCLGAIIVAAAGNRPNGPIDRRGAIVPALWSNRDATTARCLDIAPLPTLSGPLLWPVSGIQADTTHLDNAREGSATQLVAHGDHGGPIPWMESGSGDPKRGAIMTGSSLGTIGVSVAATAAWAYLPGAKAERIVSLLYDSGVQLGRPADVVVSTLDPEVRQIRACKAVQTACDESDNACNPLADPPSPPSCFASVAPLTPADFDPALCPSRSPASPCPFVIPYAQIPLDMSTLTTVLALPECNGDTLHHDGLPPGFAPEDACPQDYLFNNTAKAAVGPAPGNDGCPTCLATTASPTILYVEADNGIDGDMKMPVLKCGTDLYALPTDIDVNPQNAQRLLYNMPDVCRTAKPVWLTWTLENVAAPDGSLRTHSMTSTFLRVEAATPDTDGDTVDDSVDNCVQTANADQRDTNGDGFGNACDPDLNNDCTVNAVDLGLFKLVFFTADMDADFNGDDTVNAIDLGTVKQYFFQPPGPSGVAACGP